MSRKARKVERRLILPDHTYQSVYVSKFINYLMVEGKKSIAEEIFYSAMDDFVENYVEQFENCKEVPVHFVGSIAFYLKDELTAVLTKRGMAIGNVLRRPIDGLIAYHILNK